MTNNSTAVKPSGSSSPVGTQDGNAPEPEPAAQGGSEDGDFQRMSSRRDIAGGRVRVFLPLWGMAEVVHSQRLLFLKRTWTI
jgi:hypothetical protein